MKRNRRPERKIPPPQADPTKLDQVNLLLEKLVLVLSGAVLLALPFLAPALAPLHYVALVPWTLLFVPRGTTPRPPGFSSVRFFICSRIQKQRGGFTAHSASVELPPFSVLSPQFPSGDPS
jgi:hypothetical protein